MKVLITGAGGFVSKNLQQHLAERKDVEVVCFTRANTAADLSRLLEGVEFVFHLAGVNRPQDPQEFVTGNADLTAALVEAVEGEMRARGRKIGIVCTSSTQAARDNPYGASKRAATKTPLPASTSTSVRTTACTPQRREKTPPSATRKIRI